MAWWPDKNAETTASQCHKLWSLHSCHATVELELLPSNLTLELCTAHPTSAGSRPAQLKSAQTAKFGGKYSSVCILAADTVNTRLAANAGYAHELHGLQQ